MDLNNTISIGKDRKEVVERNEHVNIQGHQDLVVNKNQTESIYKNRSLKVQKNNSEHVLENKSVTVNMGFATQVGGAMNTAVGVLQATEVGGIKKTIVGKSYSISVGDKFEVAVGDSRLILTPDGVSITGKQILIGAEGENTVIGDPVAINPSGVSVGGDDNNVLKEYSHAFKFTDDYNNPLSFVEYEATNLTTGERITGYTDENGLTERFYSDQPEKIEVHLNFYDEENTNTCDIESNVL